MNEKNDKWLEKMISKIINTNKPQFDAEKFKQKFPDELQALKSRANNTPGITKWIILLRSPIIKAAAVFAIIFAIGLLFVREKQTPNTKTVIPQPVIKSPANIMSMMSLRNAFRQGGIEKLDVQLNETLDMYGPVVSNEPIHKLFENVNGS